MSTNKMTKEDWKKRQQDLIEHKHDLTVAIERAEGKGLGAAIHCVSLTDDEAAR